MTKLPKAVEDHAKKAEKAFAERLRQAKEERNSDANIQRKRAMSADEKRQRAVELQVEKHKSFYEKNGVERSEESIRRELAKTAERSERRKGGE